MQSFYINVELKQNTFKIPLQFLVKNSKQFKLMENIVVTPVLYKFLVKCICCIAFGSASTACCLVKSIVFGF